MKTEEFEKIVRDVIEGLPDMIKEKLDNLAFIIKDYPDAEEIRMSRTGKYNLLGLYHGVPLLRRGTAYGMYPVMPDRIFIYKSNIERIAKSEDELRSKIKEVVLHEIGHYLGMSESEVRRALGG
jgi:predicted Zn-dependent protease with MMP-like domain